MFNVSMEKLLDRANGSIYKLAIMASKRALELGAGSEKLVNTNKEMKLTSIALREIEQGKISIKANKK